MLNCCVQLYLSIKTLHAEYESELKRFPGIFLQIILEQSISKVSCYKKVKKSNSKVDLI